MPRLAAAAIALWIATSPALAQDALTLDRSIQNVLARNAALGGTRADAAAARAAADEARSGWFPRVSFTEAWQRSNEPVFVFGSLLSARRFTADNFAVDALNHPAATAAFRSTLAVDQIVFDGGRLRESVDAARRRADAAALSIDARSADLVVAATETFGRALRAQARRRAADAGLAAAREDRDRAARRRDAGLATDADVLALDVHVAALARQRIQAAGDASVALAELNRLMGEPIDHEWNAVDAAPTADEPLPDLRGLLDTVDTARPDVRRAVAMRQAAEHAGRAAGRLLVPQIAVQAALDAAGIEFAHRAGGWIAGGALQWTFSTGGAEMARRHAAAEQLTRAAADAEDARAAARVDVVTAYRRLETARLQQVAARTAVTQARESQRIVRDRFDAGMAGVNDVLRASSALVDAESNDVAARVDALVAAAALSRATGHLPRS